jgi:hypothetical protein
MLAHAYADPDLVRVFVSAFHDKSEFEVAMDKISKAFDDVNKSTALIRREGAFPVDSCRSRECIQLTK